MRPLHSTRNGIEPKPTPRVFFPGIDMQAVGAMGESRDREVRVPHELSGTASENASGA